MSCCEGIIEPFQLLRGVNDIAGMGDKKQNMSNQKLWAPWRIEYIEQPEPDGCILCDLPGLDQDRDSLILHRGPTCFVMMNLYPYNNGHLIVSPYRHISSLSLLTPEEEKEITPLLGITVEVLRRAITPDGFNIGLNLGKSAGAGIEDHLHWHVVPRWVGDTNFMPVVGATKVLVEGLKETWDKLRAEFEVVGEDGKTASPQAGRSDDNFPT